MSEEGKMQISIHQIDLYRFAKTPFDDVCDIIIQEINKGLEPDNRFKAQKLIPAQGGNSIKIYHAIKNNPPRWRDFFKGVLQKNEDLLNTNNFFSTFLAFIGTKKNIYGISGGAGNTILHAYHVNDFGTQILTRLIKKDEKVINSLKDRSYTGNILGESRIYKDEQRLTDEDQFGKIYNLVKADLNREILTKIFKFPKSELKRRNTKCIAQSSFQINKRISFERLLEIVERIDRLFDKQPKPNFTLNDVLHINKRSKAFASLAEKLDAEFKNQIFNKFISKSELDFDFCHKKFEEYYDAEHYRAISRGKEITNSTDRITFKSIMIDAQRGGFIENDTLDNFIDSFLNIRIETFDEFDDRLTSGLLFEHLNGEIFFEKSNYFYLGAEWYKINEDFIGQINRDCTEAIKQIYDTKLLSDKFDVKTEDEYISKFFNRPGVYVMHKVLKENIELCDLIAHDGKTIHLIHVKQGFNNSIRELASQISMSARRLIQDRTSTKTLPEKYQQAIQNLKGNKNIYLNKVGSQKIPPKGLTEIFNKITNDDQIIYCLAFTDTAKGKREIDKDITSFDSSIAKHSILELRKALRSHGFGFKIVQLNS